MAKAILEIGTEDAVQDTEDDISQACKGRVKDDDCPTCSEAHDMVADGVADPCQDSAADEFPAKAVLCTQYTRARESILLVCAEGYDMVVGVVGGECVKFGGGKFLRHSRLTEFKGCNMRTHQAGLQQTIVFEFMDHAADGTSVVRVSLVR
jgi:hypothetical protein